MCIKKSDRRNFLHNSAFGFFGMGIPHSTVLNPHSSMEDIKVKRYRILGRAGFRVSGFGSGTPYNETVLRVLLNAGVNIWHCSGITENHTDTSYAVSVAMPVSKPVRTIFL